MLCCVSVTHTQASTTSKLQDHCNTSESIKIIADYLQIQTAIIRFVKFVKTVTHALYTKSLLSILFLFFVCTNNYSGHYVFELDWEVGYAKTFQLEHTQS